MRTSEKSRHSQGVVRRGSLFVVIVFLALFALAPASQAQSGPVVWVARSLQRVGPDDAPGSSLQAQLSAARGEYESFQIVVRAPASAAPAPSSRVATTARPTTSSSTLWSGPSSPAPSGAPTTCPCTS